MAHYLVEFINIRMYEQNFVKHIEIDESEIETKVRDLYVDALKEDIKNDMEHYTGPWMDDKKLDSFVDDNIISAKQGYDFPRDHKASDILDEHLGYPPIGTMRYMEISDDQAEMLKDYKDNDNSQTMNIGWYDEECDRWDGPFLFYALLEIGYGKAEQILDELKKINPMLDELGLIEDWYWDHAEE